MARRNGASWLRLGIRLPARVWRVLKSPRVLVRDKLLFIVPVVLYWILPDLMPFMPIDDIAVTIAIAGWYAGRMESKYGLKT
ncbi:hypothetical protein [Cohnella sp. AR92]|uniref:hypothetical protein n=1 Tax=Cohnella sp. AR92 TaxID=648716 RepID=UPI0018646617|nr:hypothetical protein [Cohnella sp. AR92]